MHSCSAAGAYGHELATPNGADGAKGRTMNARAFALVDELRTILTTLPGANTRSAHDHWPGTSRTEISG